MGLYISTTLQSGALFQGGVLIQRGVFFGNTVCFEASIILIKHSSWGTPRLSLGSVQSRAL